MIARVWPNTFVGEGNLRVHIEVYRNRRGGEIAAQRRHFGPPDGKRITYMQESNRTFAIKWKLADGSGAEETLIDEQNYVQVPVSWSPDGRFLAYSSVSGAAASVRRIWILPLEGKHEPQEFAKTGSLNGAARFSPDGHWIAYSSNESGRSEVYVQPFPGPGGKWQTSTEGGNWPVWAPSGRELFYLNGSKIMGVAVTTQDVAGQSSLAVSLVTFTALHKAVEPQWSK